MYARHPVFYTVCMKPKSISGVVFYVQDVKKTVAFYESLGFRPGKQTDGYATIYVNWFWVDLVQVSSEDKGEEFQREANANAKGAGMFLNISVDDVDAYYADVLELGLKPSGEPQTWPWGRREFVLRDPDGYKLVFFTKK